MPSKLKVVQSGPDSLAVCWLPPRPAGRILHYNVYSKEVDGPAQKWTADGTNRLDIRNLVRSRRTVFHFQVAAVSGQAGEGPRSRAVTFTFNLSISKIPAAVVSVSDDFLVPRWSSLVLPCAALGDAPLQISWFHDGVRVQPEDVLANGSLSFARLAEDAGGNYSCQAKNRHGQDRVDYLLAVVVPPPAPHLRFAASNSSSVTIQWSMSGSGNNRTTKKISPVRSFILKFRPSRPAEQHEWRERILPAGWRSVPVGDLDCGSQYEFSLTASSHRVGNSSSSNLVTAKTKGSPPEFFPADEEEETDQLTSTSAILELTGPRWRDGGCPIQQFVVRFRTADSAEWIVAGAESPPQQTFLLGGLVPARDYVVRVTAVNSAGSSHRDYSIRTLPLDSGSSSPAGTLLLAPLFSDLRVAVPMAVSSLAILLTAVNLLLRYRYRSSSSSGDYIRPAEAGNSTIRTYADGTLDDGGSTLGKKRPFHSAASDYDADDVSPYAVFPSLCSSSAQSSAYSGGGKFSNSTRRMKTFMVDGTKECAPLPLEMSNYGNRTAEEPVYDYIAPCGGHNKKSAFMPVVPAQHQTYRHPATDSWNNQETLVVSQRL